MVHNTVSGNISPWWYMTSECIIQCDEDLCDNEQGATIEWIIYNKNKKATSIKWDDGDVTVVRCSNNDKEDIEKAIAVSYMQKHLGLSKTQYAKYISNLVKDIKNV